MRTKKKLAIYWASSCGGCEVAVLNLHQRLIDLMESWELVFCPAFIDTKKKDIEALPDSFIDVTLFNGAIRNSEDEEMARLLRSRSGILVAFGSCAHEGCVLGLSNLHSRDQHFSAIYLENSSTDNPEKTLPLELTSTGLGDLNLPRFHHSVKSLDQVVKVDYYVPGCPPESDRVEEVFAALACEPLPTPGAVLGGGTATVCLQCPRTKIEKPVKALKRIYEVFPDEERCLIEQGILCRGIATRDGCGALCPQVNMPCSGCYGAPEGFDDQGAAMIAAIGSVLDAACNEGDNAEERAIKVGKGLDAIPDYAGSFYMYSLAKSILGGRR